MAANGGRLPPQVIDFLRLLKCAEQLVKSGCEKQADINRLGIVSRS
jgi:hypothetical protein